jgi:hypothetical protein
MEPARQQPSLDQLAVDLYLKSSKESAEDVQEKGKKDTPEKGGRLVLTKDGKHLVCRPLVWHESLRALFGFGPAAFKNVIAFVDQYINLAPSQKFELLDKIKTYNKTHLEIKKISTSTLQGNLQVKAIDLIKELFSNQEDPSDEEVKENVRSLINYIKAAVDSTAFRPANYKNYRQVTPLHFVLFEMIDALSGRARSTITPEQCRDIALALIEKMDSEDLKVICSRGGSKNPRNAPSELSAKAICIGILSGANDSDIEDEIEEKAKQVVTEIIKALAAKGITD